jgi:transcriptional regulator with XRE-family HTH domain
MTEARREPDKDDAGNFQRHLEDRLERFGLQLSKEKTHCIEFGRYTRENAYKRGEKPKEFTFLDRSFISLLECGHKQPSLITIFQLAEAFNLSASKILSLVEAKIKK